MNKEELKAFRNLNTFSTKYIVNKKASSENDIATMFIYIAKLEVELEHKDKEIERLNNIINKGKMYCEDVIQEHENGEYNVSTTQLAIKEHKENIKSVLNILNGDFENYWRSDKE